MGRSTPASTPESRLTQKENPAARSIFARISRARRAHQGVLNLNSRTKRPRKTQSVSHLPLYSWRVAVVQPGTRAGNFVARRYRVHPAVADLIAALAGLGEGSKP